MSFTITSSVVLESIRLAAKAGNWQQAYQLVIDAIKDTSGQRVQGVDEAVWIWVNGAKNVNSSSGSFATYIRNYTLLQYQYRSGHSPPDPVKTVQDASDAVARSFISQLLYDNSRKTGRFPLAFA